ncbi:hypothetical protein SAMN02799638_00758 [Arthrobacter sp. UNCCL28]|nr:hypothetical protein SAMN02799638_00758 [Arthrobacter sp. UNCCL28]
MDSSHDTNANGRDPPVTQPLVPAFPAGIKAAQLSADRLLNVPQRVNSLEHFSVGARCFEAVPQAFE